MLSASQARSRITEMTRIESLSCGRHNSRQLTVLPFRRFFVLRCGTGRDPTAIRIFGTSAQPVPNATEKKPCNFPPINTFPQRASWAPEVLEAHSVLFRGPLGKPAQSVMQNRSIARKNDSQVATNCEPVLNPHLEAKNWRRNLYGTCWASAHGNIDRRAGLAIKLPRKTPMANRRAA
jgi:hypothetical protein